MGIKGLLVPYILSPQSIPVWNTRGWKPCVCFCHSYSYLTSESRENMWIGWLWNMLSGLNLPLKSGLQKQAFIFLPCQDSFLWQMWQIKKLCDSGQYQCEWLVRKVIKWGHLTPFYLTTALKKNKWFNYWVLKQASVKMTLKHISGPFFLEHNVLKTSNHAVAVHAKATVKLSICTCISTHTKIWILWPVTCRSSHTDNIQCLGRASLFSWQ